MNIRPIHGKIIVKADDPEKETSGGIIIANASNDGIIKAEVLATGPGEYNDKGKFIKPTVEPGDKILMHSMSGLKFDYEEEEYYTITNAEIIGVVS